MSFLIFFSCKARGTKGSSSILTNDVTGFFFGTGEEIIARQLSQADVF
jgi:hypothetical protein